MSEHRLTTKLIELSTASTWDKSKLEWVLEHVWRKDEPDTCLCGHYPIMEICQLRNRLNTNTAIVGNCCVKKFINLPSDLIFQAVKRIQDDEERAINVETIDHAYQKRWINAWERQFYMCTWKKRKLTGPQRTVRIKINRQVLCGIKHASHNANG